MSQNFQDIFENLSTELNAVTSMSVLFSIYKSVKNVLQSTQINLKANKPIYSSFCEYLFLNTESRNFSFDFIFLFILLNIVE